MNKPSCVLFFLIKESFSTVTWRVNSCTVLVDPCSCDCSLLFRDTIYNDRCIHAWMYLCIICSYARAAHLFCAFKLCRPMSDMHACGYFPCMCCAYACVCMYIRHEPMCQSLSTYIMHVRTYVLYQKHFVIKYVLYSLEYMYGVFYE